MMDNICNAFLTSFKANKILDQETKSAAIEKVKLQFHYNLRFNFDIIFKISLLEENIGYPDWTRDDRKLQEYHRDVRTIAYCSRPRDGAWVM